MRAWLVACTALACSEHPQVGTSRAPIIAGTASTEPAVVGIHPRRTLCDDTKPEPSCSGTLIAKRVVLTAAHCVEPESSGVGYEVVFGASSDDPTAERRIVLSVERHPQFVKSTYAYDVALLLLGEEAPVAPIALEKDLPVPAVGDRVRAIGFGVEVRDGKPGVKREGAMKVSSVSDTTFESTPDPAMSCVGDSGGAVVLDREAGAPVLIGVTSSGDVPCKEYARNFRIDAVRPMIDAFVAKAATLPPGPPMAAIGPESFCAAPCTSSSECTGGLFCRELSGQRRCVLPGIVPGTFSERCGPKDKCGAGETCTRFWTSGDFECLCHKPCAGGPTPPPPGDGGIPLPPGASRVIHVGGGGCAIGARTDGALTALVLLALGLLRRRSAS